MHLQRVNIFIAAKAYGDENITNLRRRDEDESELV